MGYKVMRLIDADVAAKEFMVLAKEPDYQHEGEDWRSGLYMAEEALDRLPAVDIVEQIFADIDKLHLHVSNEYEARAYEELKKKYGVK